MARPAEAGYEVTSDPTLDGPQRSSVDDPFGNRVELIATTP